MAFTSALTIFPPIFIFLMSEVGHEEKDMYITDRFSTYLGLAELSKTCHPHMSVQTLAAQKSPCHPSLPQFHKASLWSRGWLELL